jgi:hypothetical protein
MRRILAVAVVVVAGSAARADDTPSLPQPSVDYVATISTLDQENPEAAETVVVKHHGGWTRSDKGNLTIFRNLPARVQIWVERNPAGGYSEVDISRVKSPESRKTRINRVGQIERHAGERCEVWEVGRDPSDSLGSHELVCLTADGIEIATKRVLSSSGYVLDSSWLVKLERQPVSRGDVEPPSDLFDIARWFTFEHSAAAKTSEKRPPDFSLRMETPHAAERRSQEPASEHPKVAEMFESLRKSREGIRIIRRHFPWVYEEISYGDGRRRLTIQNLRTGQGLTFHASADAEFESLLLRPGRAPKPTDRRVHHKEEPALGLKVSAVGETCEWFSIIRSAHGSLRHCLTSDDIPLMIDQSSTLGGAETFVTIDLQRRDVGVDEMLPPGDVLTRSNWSIPD